MILCFALFVAIFVRVREWENEESLLEFSFDFGTRRYQLETAPSPVYLARHRAWQSLAAGVLGTGLLGALLILGAGHAYRFEALADELRESAWCTRPKGMDPRM